MTVRQTRSTIDRGRANSSQGQKHGDANYTTGNSALPRGREPQPTRLQLQRQAVSDARRRQLANPRLEDARPISPVRVTKNGPGKFRGYCGLCTRTFTANSSDMARSRTIQHIANEHGGGR